VDGAVNPAASQQRPIGGVDDRVHDESRDVALDDLETMRHGATAVPATFDNHITFYKSYTASNNAASPRPPIAP
jgi:hypothetical protein